MKQILDEKEKTGEVELLVRRILDEQENQIRNSMVQEVTPHREYMQSVTKVVVGVVTALVIFCGLVFAYVFGSRLDGIVDDKVVEYKIVDAYRSKLDARFDETIKGEEITEKLSLAVKDVVNKEVLIEVEKIVEESINEEVATLKSDDGEQIAILLAQVSKSTTAMNDHSCNVKKNMQALYDLTGLLRQQAAKEWRNELNLNGGLSPETVHLQHDFEQLSLIQVSISDRLKDLVE